MTEEFRQAGQEAKQGAEQIKEDLHQMKEHVQEAGGKMVEHGKQIGQDMGRQAKEKVEHCVESARQCARDKPLMVIATAFGAGLALGLLMRLTRH